MTVPLTHDFRFRMLIVINDELKTAILEKLNFYINVTMFCIFLLMQDIGPMDLSMWVEV